MPELGHWLLADVAAIGEAMRIGLNPVQLIGGGLLLMHVDRAVKHQRTCSACAGRDFVAITLDLPHLWTTPLTVDQPPE